MCRKTKLLRVTAVRCDNCDRLLVDSRAWARDMITYTLPLFCKECCEQEAPMPVPTARIYYLDFNYGLRP